jgi:glycosyltransferase involved in cell wall biosynthesis
MIASSALRDGAPLVADGQGRAEFPLPRDPSRPPPTVVLVGDYAYVNGGQAKAMLDSAIGLKRAGARPIVFAAVGPADPRLAAEGVETVCLDQKDLLGQKSKPAAALQGLWNFDAAKTLGRVLEGLPDDNTVVHVHGYAKALSSSIKSAIAARGLPAAFTLHDYFLICPNGGLYNYQTEAICALEPMSRDCLSCHCDPHSYGRKLWRGTRQWIAERGAPLSGVFSDLILVSRFQRDIVGSFLPQARRHVLSNPIDIPDLGPRPGAGRGGFVFVGRLSPEKGPLIFAEAARRAGVTATFVGEGPLQGEIAAKYPEARLLGWKTPEIVQAILRDARALVFPSVWYEAQGLAVLEAKALGTPVIVSDVSAARDEIEGGRAGLLFKSGDPDSLAAALTRLGDDSFAANLSRAAHQSYWAAPRSMQRHIDGLQRIYRGMTRDRRAALGG